MSLPAQGEIWWVELPDAGRRPGLVVTRDAAIPVLRTILVAPITTTVRGISSEVTLGADDGLPREGAASFDNLRLVPRSTLTERVGRLSVTKALELCRALRAVGDC
ncbi:MAG: type II toxin-antitoxin system PemK/MazF family toxin [Euzebya sp.]